MAHLASSQEIDDIINFLSTRDLRRVPYARVYNLLSKILINVPIITVNLIKDNLVERARIRNDKTLVYDSKSLSYRTDLQNIRRYGRANKIGKSLFYCATSSSQIDNPRMILISELDELIRSGDKEKSANYFMTVGQWYVKENLLLADIIFNEKAANALPEVKEANNKIMEMIKQSYPDKLEDFTKILRFISDHFGNKNIKTHHDYKITSCYTEFVFNNSNVDGILYSSVRADFKGRNLALLPKAVDEKLRFRACGVINIRKEEAHIITDNYAGCNKFSENEDSFEWEMYEMMPEETIKKMFEKGK